jgi:hypothetical protein
MKRFLLLPLLAASLAHAQPVQRPYPACGVSVTFSGIPAKEPQSFFEFFEKEEMGPQPEAYFYRVEYDGAITTESATCLCPTLAIASILGKDVNSVHSFPLRGIGNSITLPVSKSRDQLTVVRYVNPKAKPQCFLMQTATTNRGPESLKALANGYFDRLLKPLE